MAEAAARLARFGGRARVVKARFDDSGRGREAEAAGGRPVAGVLFDLGVSSPQLDRPERGFSYRFDGPFDMRMDRRGRATAADLVNTLSAAELTELLVENGEGRFARRLAEGIVASRPIETTRALVEVIERSLPGVARKRPGHPAKRVFQALRIEVNDELDVLSRRAGERARSAGPRGRCVVLSYHSGEDRLVKQCFLGLPAVAASARRDFRASAAPCRMVRVLTRGRPPAERRRGRSQPPCRQCQAARRRAPRTRSRPDGRHRARVIAERRCRLEQAPSSPPRIRDGRARGSTSSTGASRGFPASRRQATVLKALGAMFVVGASAVTAAAHTFVASDQQRIDTLQSQLTQTLADQQDLQLARAELESPARVLPLPSTSSAWSRRARSPTWPLWTRGRRSNRREQAQQAQPGRLRHLGAPVERCQGDQQAEPSITAPAGRRTRPRRAAATASRAG